MLVSLEQASIDRALMLATNSAMHWCVTVMTRSENLPDNFLSRGSNI